jgi:hypothetical protein
MSKVKQLSTTILALFVVITSAYSHSKNYEPIVAHPALTSMPVCIGANDFNYEKLYGKVSQNKLQSVDFIIFDSLANSLSYHTRQTTPFIWNPEFNVLATIKRGSYNPDEAGVNASNTKDNIFLRLSTDLGNTWDSTIYLLYNQYVDVYGGARYPSLSSFNYGNEIAFGYTSSLVFEAQGTWNGYLTGFFSASQGGAANIIDNKAVVNGTSYDWAVADAGILSGTDNKGNFYIIAADALTPTAGGSLTDNSNIGYRKTIELDPSKIVIPAAWSSSVFYPVDSVAYRDNELIGMRQKGDGTMYLAVAGDFIDNTALRGIKIGFSTSNDNGDTWSNFKIMPLNIIRDYASGLGLNPDSCTLGYYSKDFTVLNNGDVYFAVYFTESDASKDFAYNTHQILVIKYETATDSWSLTKIADVTGVWLNYFDDKGAQVASGVDFEIQISKTVDEKQLLVKWVDLVGVNWSDASHYTFSTSDIFVSAYTVSSSSWSAPANITQSNIYERDTFIPTILPNNLVNIPILMLHTILQAGEDSGSAYYTAALSYLRKQHVAVGHFNGNINSVEDHSTSSSTAITKIFPNPSNDISTMEFNTSNDGQVRVVITDLLGNVVSEAYNGFLNAGQHSVNINTTNLLSGAYYINVKSGSSNITKLINVVK